MRNRTVLILLALLCAASLSAQDAPKDDLAALPDDAGVVRCGGLDLRGFEALKRFTRVEELRFGARLETPADAEKAAAVLAGLKTVRRLTLDFGAAHEALLKGAARLPALEELHIVWGEGLTDDGMKPIGAMTRLRRLNLRFCMEVTDAGIAELAPLQGLQELRIPRTFQSFAPLGVAGLRALGALPEIQLLDLSGWELSGEACKAIARWTSLHELVLDEVKGPIDDGLELLAPLKQLKVLGLSNTALTDWGMQFIGTFAALEKLDLSSMNDAEGISDIGIEFLSGLRHLKELDLQGQKGVPGLALKVLAGLPALEVLEISSAGIKEKDWANLGQAPALRVLRLRSGWGWSSSGGSYGRINKEGMQALGALSRIEELVIPACGADDAGLAALAGMKQLRNLKLSQARPGWEEDYRPFTGSGLAALAECPLEKLELSFCDGLTDEGLKAGLAPLASLRVLRIEYCSGIQGHGLEGAAGCKQLREVSLANSKSVGDGALAALARAGMPLEVLDLRMCREVSDTGVKLLHGIKSLQSVTFSAAYRVVYDMKSGERRRYEAQAEVSDAAVEALRKALPGCTVDRMPPEETGSSSDFLPIWPKDERPYEGPKDPNESPPPKPEDDGPQEDEF